MDTMECEMRTAQDRYDDMKARGRTARQIRAVAVARGDNELQELAEAQLKQEVQAVLQADPTPVKVEAQRIEPGETPCS